MPSDANEPVDLDTSVVAERAADIAAKAAAVWERIEAAGGRRTDITLVAVTKTFPIETVAAAIDAGFSDLGENYGKALASRHDEAAALGFGPRWHFVGGLQRNKVKLMAGKVSLWHTIDRAVLIDEVAKRQPGARVLIQVNTTGESQKSGCRPDEAMELVEGGQERGLDVLGLMTLGPTGGGDPRRSFDQLRELGQRCGVSQLSMGMSGDYEMAVEAGATIVRIGSALFGPRPTWTAERS